MTTETKINHKCPKCQTIKTHNNFQIQRSGNPGGWCRDCNIEDKRLKRLRSGVKPRLDPNRTTHVCSKCKIEKDKFNFQIRNNKPSGWCNLCRREYCKSCKDKVSYRISKRKGKLARRARLRSVDTGKVTKQFLELLYNTKYCYYCHKLINRDDRTIEHLTPITRNGLHHPSNIVMACRWCNSSKGNKTEYEFRR